MAERFSAEGNKMPDTYIDFWEVIEYGHYFGDKSLLLVGASPLVDMALIRQRVLAHAEEMERQLGTIVVKRSTMRGGRDSIGVVTTSMSGDVRRFRHHLLAQPDEAGIDLDAFFPGGYVTPAKRKPADLLAQGKGVLAGFDAPANVNLVNAIEWKGRFTASCQALTEALAGKHGASHVAVEGTEAQAQARRQFLEVYNGMAKRLVRVVLQDVNRLHEYRLFFLDLQVNEGGQAAPEAPEAPEAAGA
jgi:hypothetical protein